MRTSDTCHLKTWLITAASDLENADTLEKLAKSLLMQRQVWLSLSHHTCPASQNNPEIYKFANFILDVLQDHAFPDDRHISEMVGINLRASALLGGHCPRPQQIARSLKGTTEDDFLVYSDAHSPCPVIEATGMRDNL